MELSKNYNFYLPSRDGDDIVDINQLSDNFRKIDEELSDVVHGEGIDQVFDGKSKAAQSGIAISGELSKYLELNDNTVFVFSGGDAEGEANIDLVIDTELSEQSQNPISNAAVTKEFKKYTPTEQADKKYVSAEDYASDKENADIERSEIKENLENIVDYVEEQGTSGIWIYEKWNSGRVKCYGSYAHDFLGTTADGALYVENVKIPLPNGLFNTKPTFACGNVDISGSVNIILWQSTNAELLVRINSTQQYGAGNGCTVHLFAVGKWK